MNEVVSVVTESRARASGWALLVLASAAVLVAACAALGGLWLASRTTSAHVSRVPTSVLGIELHVAAGNVVVVGGSRGGVSIAHTDHGVFGRAPSERHSLRHGILRLTTTCPSLVLGSCSAEYRLRLPDNVPISIRAERGSVRLEGYHGSADIATNGGSIRVDGYCGYVLGAASAAGDVHVTASCSPQRLALRSDSGDVSAVVPTGSYRVDAVSGARDAAVTGLARDDGSPWSIQAFSNSGAVEVAGT